MSESEFVPFKHNGKAVGRLSRDGLTYQTTRVRSIHYVHKHEGYGIQRLVLRDLITRGVQRIDLHVIQDDAGGRSISTRYRVSPKWWLQVGFTAVLRDRDGTQVFVSVRQLEKAALDRDHFQRAAQLPQSVGCVEPGSEANFCVACYDGNCRACTSPDFLLSTRTGKCACFEQGHPPAFPRPPPAPSEAPIDCRPCLEGDHRACLSIPFLGYNTEPCACHWRGHTTTRSTP